VLYDYNAWANHRSLDAASALSEEKFVQAMGSSFGSVRDTLRIFTVPNGFWLERFQGRSPSSLPDTTQFKNMAGITRALERARRHRLLGFVRGLTRTDLERVFEYKTLKFGVYSNPLWESMQHPRESWGRITAGRSPLCCGNWVLSRFATDLMHFYRERATAASA